MTIPQPTKKDIIAINQSIGEQGTLHNQGSIDFALSQAKGKKAWLQELSYFVRSLLVDHAFHDGNKRTALVLVITYLEDRDLDYDKDYLLRAIWKISKNNISSINRIMGAIKGGIVFRKG
ncbi:Fic family protein [Candidatus Woesearchaeota archaeon]|nr:Fic family protein [Candidatus Woesearchaeota archaeon]